MAPSIKPAQCGRVAEGALKNRRGAREAITDDSHDKIRSGVDGWPFIVEGNVLPVVDELGKANVWQESSVHHLVNEDVSMRSLAGKFIDLSQLKIVDIDRS